MWFIRTISSSLRNRLYLWLILPLLLISLAAIGCSVSREPDSLEERAQGIDRSLMCPVCPSETIEQSQVALAHDMRAIVREKLAAGESREEILQFFVDKYDIGVLAEPPKKGFSLTIWLVPPVVALMGGVVLLFAVRGLRRRPTGPLQPEGYAQEGDLESYLTQVDADLQEGLVEGEGADSSSRGGS